MRASIRHPLAWASVFCVAATLNVTYADEGASAPPIAPQAEGAADLPLPQIELTPQVKRATGSDSIQRLQLNSEALKLMPSRVKGKGVLRGTLSGQLSGESSALLVGTESIELSENGEFQLPIELEKDTHVLVVRAVDEKGDVYQEEVEISVPSDQWKSIFEVPKKDGEKEQEVPRWLKRIGVGLASRTYEQSGFRPYTGLALLPNLDLLYRLEPGRWDIGLEASAQVIPFSSSQSYSMGFLEVKMRAAFHTQWLPAPWTLSVEGGAGYATSFLSDAPFGYQNATSLQLYPVIRLALSNQSVIGGYAKLSPFLNGLGFKSLSDREIGAGLFYRFAPFAKSATSAASKDSSATSLQVSAEYSGLSISDEQSTVNASTLSLKVGLNW